MKPTNKYIGRRYVPKQCGDWNKSDEYESLSVVLYQGNSYTSKQDVPRGIDIGNKMFWVQSANYNAQVTIYEQNVRDYHQYVIDQIGIINNNFNDFKEEQEKSFESFKTEQKNVFNDFSDRIQYFAVPDITDNDSARAIQNAINSLSSGGIVYLKSGKQYVLNKSITIPYNVSLIGNGATIEINSNSNLSNDFIFYLNTTLDKETIKPNGGESYQSTISDFNIVNSLSSPKETVKCFYTKGGRPRLDNIRFTRISQAFLKEGNNNRDYGDNISLSFLDFYDCKKGLYLIDINYNGDGVLINNISNTSNNYYNDTTIRISQCYSGKIFNIINGDIELKNCDGITLENIHQEIGRIITSTSGVSIRNVNQWFRGVTGLIIRGGDADKRNKNVSIDNFNIVYTDDIYKPSSYSDEVIHCIFTNSSVTINNLYTMSNNSGFFGRLGTPNISTDGNSINKEWKNLDYIYSKTCIINSTKILTPNVTIEKESSLPTLFDLSMSTGSYSDFFNVGVNYYYKIYCLIGFKDRKIGNSYPEKSITPSSGNNYVNIAFTQDRGLNNLTFRIYRGSTSGNYTHYVDVSLPNGARIRDYGYSLDNGELWKNVDHNLNYNDYINRCEVKNKNIVYYGNYGGYGTWLKGDIFMNGSPSDGSEIGKYYNGTKWVSYGKFATE